ncbi:Ser Thr phosphatase family protein [Seminavis robusta]|uniref:Ser Thr phosphatase family protein n=1 Tax=Seminavis robusta TaxID=568900 RepID=A0A9N8HIS9_9STRA|nr:Ser Thr phosphatase family protein [Seminavis robusta]|eukprot:Sro642_g180160.1 Ser Thr phosphatase family protein (372) ;mRNA; r:26805-28007
MNQDFEDLGETSLSDGADPNSIRILQVTDLHIFPRDCESFEGIPLGDSFDRCLQLIDQLVKDAEPDVIVFTGDIMDGRGPWGRKEAVVDTFQYMIGCLHDTPWLFLPGNHDDDHSPWSRADLVQIMKLPGSLQQSAKGFHHTLLLSKKSNIGASSIRVRLHIFDSGGNHPNKRIMYYNTPATAVQGFSRYFSDRQTAESDVTGLVYIHIPTPEFQFVDPVIGENRLFAAALAGGKIPKQVSKLMWLIKLLGVDRIAGCSRGPDTGLVPAIHHANKQHHANIQALFCGHDHHSDAVFYRKGLFLGYGRSGAMTPPYDWEGAAPNVLAKGGRVVEVSRDGVAKTWIQTASGFEDGSLLDMTNYEPDQKCCWPF